MDVTFDLFEWTETVNCERRFRHAWPWRESEIRPRLHWSMQISWHRVRAGREETHEKVYLSPLGWHWSNLGLFAWKRSSNKDSSFRGHNSIAQWTNRMIWLLLSKKIDTYCCLTIHLKRERDKTKSNALGQSGIDDRWCSVKETTKRVHICIELVILIR